MSSSKPDRRGETVEEFFVARGEFDAISRWDPPVLSPPRHCCCVECLSCGLDGVGVVGRRVDVAKERSHVVFGLAAEM